MDNNVSVLLLSKSFTKTDIFYTDDHCNALLLSKRLYKKKLYTDNNCNVLLLSKKVL